MLAIKVAAEPSFSGTIGGERVGVGTPISGLGTDDDPWEFASEALFANTRR